LHDRGYILGGFDANCHALSSFSHTITVLIRLDKIRELFVTAYCCLRE
jgi:hypothetical protein